MRSEVRGLRQEIDSKNEELLKKAEELKDAREERSQLLKRLQWKEEELEHERRSKQWMESELNHKVHRIYMYMYMCRGGLYSCMCLEVLYIIMHTITGVYP